MNDNNSNDGMNDPQDDFYYMGPFNDKFKNMWNDWQKMQNENASNYMNFDDIMRMFHDIDSKNMRPSNHKSRKPRQNPNVKMSRTVIMPDDYQRLLEIRGYLNITEQYAYVKTLDKILNSMNPFITEPPKDNK
jgi:hypothetical protein